MADAIENVLERHAFRAGRFSVGYRSCDDSNPQSGNFDQRMCASNANAYADARKLVAVIGTYNSACAEIEIPILNSAPGPLAMISPANTSPGLTRRGFERPPWGYRGEPGIYYPTGTRNFVRLPPLDDDQGPAYALLAQELGLRSVYVLDGSELHRGILTRPFRYAARKLGIRVAGATAVEEKLKDYDGLAEQIARSGAQGVVLGVDPVPARPIIRAIRARLGARFPIMASNYFVFVRDVLKFIGPAARGIYVATTDVTRGQLELTPAAKRFVEDFGEDGTGGYILESAQATELVLRAIARSDGTRESVLEKLRASRVKDGILGNFRFDRNGDLTPAKMPIIRITGSSPPSSRLPKFIAGSRHRPRGRDPAAADPLGRALISAGAACAQRRPFARSFFIVSTSTFSGAWPFTPGPSKSAGSFSKRGSERKAAQPRGPISPSPGGAWRSRFEPRAASESFTCRHLSRRMPTTFA